MLFAIIFIVICIAFLMNAYGKSKTEVKSCDYHKWVYDNYPGETHGRLKCSVCNQYPGEANGRSES